MLEAFSETCWSTTENDDDDNDEEKEEEEEDDDDDIIIIIITSKTLKWHPLPALIAKLTVHRRTKFQPNRAMQGWVINGLTNLRRPVFQRAIIDPLVVGNDWVGVITLNLK